MEKIEFIQRLIGPGPHDVAFKKAWGGVPDSAYRTASAFANTKGGWLVFGVAIGADGFDVVGTPNAERVRNEFLRILLTGRRLSRAIAAEGRRIEHEGMNLLIFRIPEARRQDKPIHFSGDIRRSFLRRGARNFRCTTNEIERMLIDAGDRRKDVDVVDLDVRRCFDVRSLRRYRRHFRYRNSEFEDGMSHVEFLTHWGLVIEVEGRPTPTRAAILLFGNRPSLRQVLPRPVVDWQWRRGDGSRGFPHDRWADRLVIGVNLMETWRILASRYVRDARKPFSLDPQTMERNDLPPEYPAFREAAINLLIHQDYADHERTPVIRSFADRIELWNPGGAMTWSENLLGTEPTAARNPRIVGAFRRIGLSKQAGTGIRSIINRSRELGRTPPVVENDRQTKAFQLTLHKAESRSVAEVVSDYGYGSSWSSP